jgi:AsmA protein
LYVLVALLLVLAGVALWLMQGFDGGRLQRVAIDWMRTHHERELVFDGPATLRLWPRPALSLQRVRLSERGQPQQPFASIESASLSLRLWPLLSKLEAEVESVSARGVTVRLRGDAEGHRNVDDLLDRMAGGEPGSGQLTMGHLELADVALDVDDALAGVRGRLRIVRFDLGAFGPGRVSPLQWQAQAELSEPPMKGTLELDARLSFPAAPRAGAPRWLQLDKARLHLRGQGLGFDDLDARLLAQSLRVSAGTEQGLRDSRLEIESARLQFGGTRLGWQVDGGEFGLARLRLDILRRTLGLEKPMLQLKGRRHDTTFDARFSLPTLEVKGDTLRGGPLDGHVVLGGDQRLQVQLRSQPPSGSFERLTVPALQLDVDGQFGSSAIKGQAGATLVLETQPLVLAFDAMSLRLGMDDPALPPLQLALDGQAQVTTGTGSGRVEGSINDQRVDARFDVRHDRPRPFIDLQARLGTLDLSRFVVPAQRSAAPMPITAATPVDLQPLRRADVRLQLNVAQLLHAPYRVDGLELQARVDNGQLDLQRAAGHAWGGRFEASGSANAANGRLALRLRADEVDLRAVFAATTGNDSVRGRGRVEADLRSQGATLGALRAGLDGQVKLALRSTAIRGVDLTQTLHGWRTASQSGNDTVGTDAGRQTEFSQLDGSFEVRDGVARGTDLDGRSQFLNVGGEGSIDMVQGRVDYLLRARVVNTAGGRAGPELVMLNRVVVPIELHGPFDAVEWRVHWAAVTATVAAMSVPNVARGAVGGVARGATGVLRGAAGLPGKVPGVVAPAPRN